MELKKSPNYDKEPISTFILHKNDYKIDYEYQREAGTWSKLDEQYLIDTILRGFAMPAIFIHSKGNDEYIVDGQQRLNTIWEFADDELPLGEKYSLDIINHEKNKESNDGKPVHFYSELSKEWRNRFDRYSVPTISLSGYNDEEIRDLFRRLQHGKPLNTGEILNAYPGDIVLTMRKLAEHKFFKDITMAESKRYKYNHMAAQFMFLESEGIKTITPQFLYKFFENNKNLNTNSDVYHRVNKTLNYIVSTFGEKTPELRRGWNITLYLLVSHLLKEYSMQNQKDNLKKFFIDFYGLISDAFKSGDEDLIDFNNAISKATNEVTNIQTRHEIILRKFLENYNPVEKAEERLFGDDQKINIFRRDEGKCQCCGVKLKFGGSETHYHHKVMHSKGGKTTTENGLLLCKNCHLTKFHHENK